MREFYNPEIKPSLIPDLATSMYDTTHKSIFDGNPYGSSYRVSGYLKAVPKSFTPSEDQQPWHNDMMKRLFHEWHPNWRKEYKLVPCLKEEATHVWGTGVCGCTASLTDSRYVFLNEPIGWSEEQRKEYNEDWVKDLPHLLKRMSYDLQVVEGTKHTKGYLRIRRYKVKDPDADLFTKLHRVDKKARAVIEKYSDMDMTYENCEALLAELKPLHYTFEYGLDAIPYDLKYN